jgi:hypothetical protein
MVRRRACAVSNHEGHDIGLILRDAAYAAPQDEGIKPLMTQ